MIINLIALTKLLLCQVFLTDKTINQDNKIKKLNFLI